jgi:hypothetical protein
MTTAKVERKAGWNWIHNSRKWHYFGTNGIAACGGYAILGSNADAITGGDDSPDNCKKCMKARRQVKC